MQEARLLTRKFSKNLKAWVSLIELPSIACWSGLLSMGWHTKSQVQAGHADFKLHTLIRLTGMHIFNVGSVERFAV
jgi:hypothetical protein